MTVAPQDFRETPVLEGEHVRLEPLTRDHAAGLLDAADDDAVFAWHPTYRPTSPQAAAELVDFYLGKDGVHPWVQIDLASGEVAGITTFYDVDPDLRTVAIGWTWIARRFWRTALNTDAKLLLLRRAFDDLDCVRVVWHVDILNDRSQAAVLRLGAQREGVMRKHKMRRDGSWRDTVTFSMTDDEWPAARTALEARLAR